jgi:amidohydrolase
MTVNEKILQLIDEYKDEAISIRHHLHENPEVSTQEVETSKYLKDYLKDFDLEIEEVPAEDRSSGNGFTATFDTGKPGKTIGLRTDIDALPVTESDRNLKQERIVKSKNDGAMHACGHDGHMTTLLMTVKIVDALKDHLSGKIIFIFEEGEENGTGIRPMVKHLEGRDIDAIYGNHLASFLDVGKVAADPGPVMAAAAAVHFNVVGKGGHGSRPDLSINPLYAGVDILNSISVAWNNQVNVEETVTLGLTKFQVGEALNVFDDKATIGGTLRYFNEDEGIQAHKMLMKVANNVAEAHNCTIEELSNSGPRTIPVVNDEELAEIVQDGVEDLFPGHLEKNVNWFASETFSLYSRIAPSVLSFVGIRNEELGSGAEHHNEYFDMDNEALTYSIGTMAKFVVDFLGEAE